MMPPRSSDTIRTVGSAYARAMFRIEFGQARFLFRISLHPIGRVDAIRFRPPTGHVNLRRSGAAQRNPAPSAPDFPSIWVPLRGPGTTSCLSTTSNANCPHAQSPIQWSPDDARPDRDVNPARHLPVSEVDKLSTFSRAPISQPLVFLPLLPISCRRLHFFHSHPFCLPHNPAIALAGTPVRTGDRRRAAASGLAHASVAWPPGPGRGLHGGR